jgi:cobalt-precorrin 5A hydrolase/precorrin-3B C17-methyltransferase
MPTDPDQVILHLTRQGEKLAQKLADLYPEALSARLAPGLVAVLWPRTRAFIFIMASGIVTRTVAPLLRSKKSDPAVLVIDEAGRFVIPLLGGHLGGANELARKIAAFLGAQAVITTASEVQGLTPLDLWACKQNLAVENPEALARAGTLLVNDGRIYVYSEEPLDLPPEYQASPSPEEADVIISHRTDLLPVIEGEKPWPRQAPLWLRPRNLVVGIGCHRGIKAKEIWEALSSLLVQHQLSPSSLAALATVDFKGEEEGLQELARDWGLLLATFPAADINRVTGITPSAAARWPLGVQAVAEPAAILAAKGGELIVPKKKLGRVTLAVARLARTLPPQAAPIGPPLPTAPTAAGKLYVVGTGPGDPAQLTGYAKEVLAAASVLVGYPVYLQLLGNLREGKKIISSGMTQEKKRCREAIALARAGETVALVCGGDPGIYALAGLVFELMREEGEDVYLEIVPGVSAVNACAARLGAPLIHDFAVISLSDRLTSWELIARRLKHAAQGDFVIVLLNPQSKGRPDLIKEAGAIIQAHRLPETPVGLVRAAYRKEEEVTVTTLAAFLEQPLDMQTTVVIGNSRTFAWQGKMITPRGYLEKP